MFKCDSDAGIFAVNFCSADKISHVLTQSTLTWLYCAWLEAHFQHLLHAHDSADQIRLQPGLKRFYKGRKHTGKSTAAARVYVQSCNAVGCLVQVQLQR